MPKTNRPRRSVLYMPGSNARALEKARSLPADGLILDLEDAVAPDAKEEARKMVTEAIKAGGYGKREILLRVNGADTPWGAEDLVAAATSGADAVLLPKVGSGEQVREAEGVLKANGAPESLAIWCMMETPLGILHAEEIAKASPRLGGFVMGTSDLTKDLQASHTPMRLPMLTSLGLCLLAARAYDLAIVDGVYLDLNDEEGFAAACQVGPANKIFAPSEDEIAFSHKVIDAHKAAAAEGKGVVVVDGKLIENLHVMNAERIVQMSEAIAEMEKEAAS
ncbi:MAG: HpcH/HpaI aldolase/citrate lyase family protein [Alphaproteobacteria bacterium]